MTDGRSVQLLDIPAVLIIIYLYLIGTFSHMSVKLIHKHDYPLVIVMSVDVLFFLDMYLAASYGASL